MNFNWAMFLKLGDGVLRLNHMKLLIFDYLDLQKQFHVVQLTIRVGFFKILHNFQSCT